MAQAVADQWEEPYLFHKENTVVLQHHADKNIRVSPKNASEVDSQGGFGKKARWLVSVSNENGNKIVTLKNEESGDFLRITKDGKDVNAAGKGQGLCKFKVTRMSTAICKLESVASPGAYIAVNKGGDVVVGKGGKFCRIEMLKKGKPQPFTKPYRFMKVKTIVMEHRDHKYLRVSPNNEASVDSEGGRGEYAQWEAIPTENGAQCQFKSKKSGDYLRIKGNGDVDAAGKGQGLTFFKVHQVGAKNEVRLESRNNAGKFMELDPQKNTFIGGEGKNRKSIFTMFRDE